MHLHTMQDRLINVQQVKKQLKDKETANFHCSRLFTWSPHVA